MEVAAADGPTSARKPGEAVNPKEFRGWWLMQLARQPTIVNATLTGVAIFSCAALDSVQSMDGNPISSCKEPAMQYDMYKCMQWSVCGCEWKMGDDSNTSQTVTTQANPDGLTLVSTISLTRKLGCVIQKVENKTTRSGVVVMPPVTIVSTKCDNPDDLVGYVYPGECKGSWDRASVYTNASDGNKTYTCQIELPYTGFSPSSLIVTSAGVANAFVLLTAPVVGTICDVTDHRRRLWKISAAILTITTYGLALLGTGHFWIASLACKTISAIFYEYTVVPHFAYLPELGDKRVQGRAAGTGQGVGFLMQLLQAVGVTIISSIIGFNDINTGILSTCIAGTFLLVGSPISIWHMGDRPARVQLKGNVVKATFANLYQLALTVRREYSEAFIFLWSYAVGSAGGSGVITIASTYFVSELKLSASGFGVVVAIVLIVGMPCAFICGRVMNDIGMKRLLLIIYVAWTALGVLTPLVMYKEEHKLGSYILGGLYGILLAMYFTVNPALFASLIPPSREAEFMGLYVFFAYLLRWLPLIIYGACDNSGGPRLGLGICGTIFFVGGGCILCFVDTAKAETQRNARAQSEDAEASGK
jgi:UMF1 family MFS transporter